MYGTHITMYINSQNIRRYIILKSLSRCVSGKRNKLIGYIFDTYEKRKVYIYVYIYVKKKLLQSMNDFPKLTHLVG